MTWLYINSCIITMSSLCWDGWWVDDEGSIWDYWSFLLPRGILALIKLSDHVPSSLRIALAHLFWAIGLVDRPWQKLLKSLMSQALRELLLIWTSKTSSLCDKVHHVLGLFINLFFLRLISSVNPTILWVLQNCPRKFMLHHLHKLMAFYRRLASHVKAAPFIIYTAIVIVHLL